MENKPAPVWLDCDPGHDDMMAIILAAYNPHVKLIGISTTYGNSSVEHTTKNACGILEACGIKDVPIIKGASYAICNHKEEHMSEKIHGEDGLGTSNKEKLPETNIQPVQKKNPYLYITEAILASPEKVHVVATGNLTNIAILLKAFPEVKENISQISFMGGAFNFGNITPSAEANIWHDPEAADVVIRCGLKVVMVPLEVTHTVLVTPEIIAEIEKMNSRFARLCVGVMQFFSDAYKNVYGFEAPPLHDPCAVAYIIAPELFEVKFCNTRIERVSDSTKGRTICDFHKTTKLKENCHVTTKIDVPRFWNMMLDALKEANSKSKMV